MHLCTASQLVVACDKCDPVILKRWSLSLPVFVMWVIIFLAEPGAAQVLWGPCPRNDSALIKERSTLGPGPEGKSELGETTANRTYALK